MVNTHSADEYNYENENARLLIESILPKLQLDTRDIITEENALYLYNKVTHNPARAFNYGNVVFVPMYNLQMV